MQEPVWDSSLRLREPEKIIPSLDNTELRCAAKSKELKT